MKNKIVYLTGLLIFFVSATLAFAQEAKPVSGKITYTIGELSFKYIPQPPKKYGEPYGIFISYKGQGIIEGSHFELHSPGYKKSYWRMGKNIPQIISTEEDGKKVFTITETDPEIKYTHIQRIEISRDKVVLKWSGELASDSSIPEAGQQVCYGKIKTSTIAGCEVARTNWKRKPIEMITGTIPYDKEEAKESNIVGWKAWFTQLSIKSRAGDIRFILPSGGVILGPYTNKHSKEYPSFFWLGHTTKYSPGVKRTGEAIYEFNVKYPSEEIEREQTQTTLPSQEIGKVTREVRIRKGGGKGISFPLPIPSDLIFCAGNQLWQKDNSTKRIPVLIVNKSPFFQEYPVTLQLKNTSLSNNKSITLLDQAGFEVPCQMEGNSLVFIAKIKGNSWRSYYIYEGSSPSPDVSMVKETKYAWIVDTGRIKAKFLKRPTGTFGPLYFLSSGENNLLSDWHYTFKGYFFWGAHAIVDGEILENGPVKVTIGYPKGKPNMLFTLFKDSPAVYFKTASGGKKEATVWLDLYENTPTRLIYPAKEGVKSLKMTNPASGRHRTNPTPLSVDIQGNWAYFKGDKGSLGFLFNRKSQKVTISDMTNIQTITLSSVEKGKDTEGIILVDTDPSIFAEKLVYPLEIYQLNSQNKGIAPIEKIPDWTKDFIIWEWVTNNWGSQSRIHYETKDEIHKLKLMGVNQISLCFADYYFWNTDFPENRRLYDSLKDIVDICHQYKVAVGGDIRPNYDVGIWGKKEYGEDFAFESEKWRKEYLAPKIKELCKYPLDFIFLADESAVKGSSFDFRKKFKQRYGYDCPEVKDWKKVDISNERIFNRLYLMIEEYTDYCRWCNQKIRKYKPEMKTIVNQTSGGQFPGGWSYPWTYVDPGKVIETGTDMTIDPYFADTDRRRYVVRFLNAAHQNQGTLTIAGNTADMDFEYVGRQILLNTLFGGKGFALFTVSRGACETKPAKIQNFYYNLLWKMKNNIGSYLMASRPVKFIAVPWSRDSWYTALKQGGKLTQYWRSEYDESILNLAYLSSLQWEYIFEKYIPAEVEKYPLVILPEDKYLSENIIKELTKYIKGGGTLIIYGSLIEKEKFQKLMGIGEVILDKRAGVIEGERPVLVSNTYLLGSLPPDVEVLKKIKKSSGFQPSIISRKIDKGRIIYFAFDLDNLFKNNPRDANYLVKEIVSSKFTLLVETDTLLEPVLFQGKDYYLLGLHNTGSEKIFSQIKVNIPSKNQEVFDLFEGRKIFSTTAEGGLVFSDTLNPGEVKFYRLSRPGRFPEYKVVSTEKVFYLKLDPYQIKEETVAKKKRYVTTLVTTLQKAHQNNKICVGIVETPVKTADVLIESLKDEKGILGIKIAPVDITPELLKNLNVLVFEGSLHAEGFTKDLVDTVKEFVKDGGGILLTHGAVGGLWFAPLTFPEIGKGTDKVIRDKVIPTKEGKFLTSGLSPEKKYKHPYYDHFVLRKGSETSIPIFKDEQGKIVVLTGIEGKGKVALSGFLFGLRDDGTKVPPRGWAKEFFVNILKWLGRKK